MKKGTDNINLHPCNACSPMQVRCSARSVCFGPVISIVKHTEYHGNDRDSTGILFLGERGPFFRGLANAWTQLFYKRFCPHPNDGSM